MSPGSAAPARLPTAPPARPHRIGLPATPAIRVACLGAVLIFLATLRPQPAAAHAFLVRTTPAQGDRLAATPTSISLQFSEQIVGGERITVTTPDGGAVAVGPVERVESGRVFRVQLPPLDRDIYIVSWQAIGQDGHQALGEFAFAVGSDAQLPAGGTGEQAATSWVDALLSWLVLVPLLLAFGDLLSERIVWSPVAREHARMIPRLPLAAFLAVALTGSVAQFVILARRAAADGPLVAGWPRWSGVLGERPGALTAAIAVSIAYALWLMPARSLRRWAVLPLLIALVAVAARGHAGATPHWWAMPVTAVHLLAVSFWMGALGRLALVATRLRDITERPILCAGLRRYMTAALWLVAVVLMTGSASTVAQLSRPSDVLRTRYGQALLLKLVMVAITLALAYAARRTTRLAARDAIANPLPRLARLEIAGAVLTIALAAILANTAPPRRAGAAALLGPPPLAGEVLRKADLAGPLAVHLAASDAGLQVRVLAPSGEPSTDARVAIAGLAPDGVQINVSPRPCGPGCVTSAFPWQPGTTTISVDVASAQWGGGSLNFGVAWPPRPADPAVLERVAATMNAQPAFTVRETVSSGPGATVTNTFPIDGPAFVALEPYANGGASDVQTVPSDDALAVTFYLTGSELWFELTLDDAGRLRREVIVSPGHRIARTFTYGAAPGT